MYNNDMYGILAHTKKEINKKNKKKLIRLTHTLLQPTSDTNKKEIIKKN